MTKYQQPITICNQTPKKSDRLFYKFEYSYNYVMLDNTDLQIISRLSNNGRISLTDLSTHVDISRVAVANRIEKLITHNVLRISASINLEKLSYQTLIVELQIDREKLEPFKKAIENCSHVLHSFEITGAFNYLLICAGKDNNSLRIFIDSAKKFSNDCKVTIASNPQTPSYAQLKSPEACKCKLCLGEP